MRILSLDWGTVRIGAALSDPEGKIAFPLDNYLTSKNALDEIKKIVEEKEVGKILVGLPKSLSGRDSESSRQARQFAEKIKKQVACEIELIDERLSSVGAAKILRESGLDSKKQRQNIDNIAAQQMLQAYLDTK